MADVETAPRALFVLDEDRTVTARWLADDWISPPPVDDIETAVSNLWRRTAYFRDERPDPTYQIVTVSGTKETLTVC